MDLWSRTFPLFNLPTKMPVLILSRLIADRAAICPGQRQGTFIKAPENRVQLELKPEALQGEFHTEYFAYIPQTESLCCCAEWKLADTQRRVSRKVGL